MQRLNAIDSISPAFARTHELLFKPFRIGRSWKLAASSYLALAGGIFFPVPLLALALRYIPQNQASVRALAAIVIVFYSVIMFVFFYLGLRMSFVTFEMLATRQVMIAPMWRRYGLRVWPWIGLKAAIGTVLSVAMLPLLVSIGRGFFEFAQSMPRLPKGSPPDPALTDSMFQQVMILYGGFLLVFVVLKLASTLLDDFVKPFYQLEPISLGTAIQRAYAVLSGDFLNCVVYVVLKYILTLIGFMMQNIATQVCFIPIVLIGVVATLLGRFLMHAGGPIVSLIVIAAGVILGLAAVAALIYASVGTAGYLLMLLDAYALYFLGGRYPLLGNLLEPGPGAPFTPPPVFPSREERKDSDDGPPMPMNPAVA
jgi:hypothetical protein